MHFYSFFEGFGSLLSSLLSLFRGKELEERVSVISFVLALAVALAVAIGFAGPLARAIGRPVANLYSPVSQELFLGYFLFVVVFFPVALIVGESLSFVLSFFYYLKRPAGMLLFTYPLHIEGMEMLSYRERIISRGFRGLIRVPWIILDDLTAFLDRPDVKDALRNYSVGDFF